MGISNRWIKKKTKTNNDCQSGRNKEKRKTKDRRMRVKRI
jgi:hypothetical protein